MEENSQKVNETIKTKGSKKGLIIIAVIYIFYKGEVFIDRVFGKLTDTANGETHLSTSTRINAVIYPFKAFAEAPFFGVGYTEFTRISQEYCNSMATCTFLNWLAIYGIFGFLFIFFCIAPFLSHGKTPIAKFGLLVFSILLFSTESFLQIGFIYIFVFYGAKKISTRNFSDS